MKTVNSRTSPRTVETVISSTNHPIMNIVNTAVGFKSLSIVSIVPLFMSVNTVMKSVIATIVILFFGVKTVIIVERAIISRIVCRAISVSDASIS